MPEEVQQYDAAIKYAQDAELKYIAFKALIKEMREAQGNYFRTRSKEALNDSKRLERMVDNFIKADGTTQQKLL